MTLALAAAIIFLCMIEEARVAARHEAVQRRAGAVEPAGDVYRIMRIAYPVAFLAMLAEGVARHVGLDAAVGAGAGLFTAAKALKYWAIATLGDRWTFRVLVPPGRAPIATGPYRWVRHPNYLAIVGELTGAALATHALVTGPIGVLGFGALMLRRVRVEERALNLR